MTENTKNKRLVKIGLTLAQIIAGCITGVLACLILLYLVNLVWGGIQGSSMNGFISAILLLISFLIIYFGTVVAAAEGVRQMGRLVLRIDPSKKPVSLKHIYEGSFLGLCAAVAILSVTRGDWDSTLQEWGSSIRALGKVIYVFVMPVKLLTLGYSERLANPSALFLLIISAPIGAVISYYVSPTEKKDHGKKDSIEDSAKETKNTKNKSKAQ